MTATPTPAAAAAPSMAHSPDSEPAPTPRAGAAARAGAGAGTLAAGRTRLRDQIAANPLLSLFGAVLAGILGFMGTVVIALLAYTLATTNDRFAEVNDRFAEVNDRFARLEAKVDAGFAAQDAKIDEINLKLTALIAALNMAPEVGAALQGTLLDPAAAGTAATDPPVGAASGPRQP